MSQKWTDVKAESAAFAAEVKEIEEWWQSDSQKHIKRYVQHRPSRLRYGI